MSELISEIAAGFLGVGDTLGGRRYRLTGACNARNIAGGSPDVRLRQLEQYKEGYLRSNPKTSAIDLANIIKDMELMIERKLKMFPNDHRRIVTSRVVRVGNDFGIEVGSATLP